MEQFKEFVVKYFKIIVVVLSFSLTLYIQHVNNTAQIAELETKCIGLEVEIKNQYDRINRMKLGGLAGRRGLVVEDLSGEDRKNKGGLVLLEEAYMDEFVWFIPEKSVTYE